MSISATATAAVAPSSEAVASLLGSSGIPALADGAPPAESGTQASLQALVGIMNASREEVVARGVTAKSKAKAKAKARVQPVVTRTPAELRNSIRSLDVV